MCGIRVQVLLTMNAVRSRPPRWPHPKSLHTRFIHLMSRTHCYYSHPCAASVQMLCGSYMDPPEVSRHS